MDWFRSLPEYRRKIFFLLVVAILLTLPCYCIGLALLILAPEETAPPPAAPAGSGIAGEAASLWPAAPGAGLAAVEPVLGLCHTCAATRSDCIAGQDSPAASRGAASCRNLLGRESANLRGTLPLAAP